MHGWQFDLASGRCLTSDDRKLVARPLTAEDGELPEIPTEIAAPVSS
jgi:UDP-MurNAc hydroxylase